MAIVSTPPELGSYNHVMVRADRDASIERGMPIRFVTYAENVTSRSIEWHGRRVHAIFLKQEVSARRAWRLGWVEITKQWFEHVEKSIVAPTSDAQKSIFDVLNESWKTKKEIIAEAGIKDTEWRTAIRYLIDKGLAEQTGSTNRTYKYRLAEVEHG